MKVCLMMLKPDAIKNGNVGNIIKMVEEVGYTLYKAKTFKFTLKQAEIFYAEHKGKDFFDRNIKFIRSGIVLAVLLEYPKRYSHSVAIKDLRSIAGATDPRQASFGTIRLKFGTELPKNAVHVSDSVKSCKREMAIIFGE